MPYTIEEVLSDKDIKVLKNQGDAFQILIGELQTPVTITLSKGIQGMTQFHQSHVIKTPLQAGAYRTSRTIEDDPAYALHRAIDGIKSWYQQAVTAGHKPSEEWLVPN